MNARIALFWIMSAATASADQLCSTAALGTAHTNWGLSVNVVRFDPALGTLNSVTISITSTLTGTAAVELPNPTPSQVTSTISANVSVQRPDHTNLATAVPSMSFVDDLTAYDGTIDFMGTSGVTHSGIVVTDGQSVPAPGGDFALFTGPSGSPGTITLPVVAIGTSVAIGPGPVITQFITNVDASVSVCYAYTPSSPSFCFGDGSGTACPCGNSSALGAGEGCANSLGTGGRFYTIGNASVSNDTLTIGCSGIPLAAPTLFFQGTVQQNLGAGSTFGDGLRCVGGTQMRIGLHVASAGTAVYPYPGEPSVSAAGAVPANSVRFYQAWYRNSATFCTSSTFNLSQGLSVTWLP